MFAGLWPRGWQRRSKMCGVMPHHFRTALPMTPRRTIAAIMKMPISKFLRAAICTTLMLGGALLMTQPAHAQMTYGSPDAGNPLNATGASLFDLGSNFLTRIGKQSTSGFDKAFGTNPNGGGAPGDEAPRYRTWIESYGLTAKTDAQGAFVGDTRHTVGGVAGISAKLAPDFTVGVSIDQSHTSIHISGLPQWAKYNLTQVGVNAVYERGPWTFALAAVHGWANIDSSRIDFGTPAFASYNGGITGVLAEAAYYYAVGQQGRIVPKAAIEYTHFAVDAFTETGGIFPISASSYSGDRTRLIVGAEAGHYWIVDQKVVDLAGYAKLIGNVSQNMGAISFVSGGFPVTVQGLRERDLGVDAGATLSVNFTRTIRAYLAYDGKFRSNFQSHTGTLGLDMRW